MVRCMAYRKPSISRSSSKVRVCQRDVAEDGLQFKKGIHDIRIEVPLFPIQNDPHGVIVGMGGFVYRLLIRAS